MYTYEWYDKTEHFSVLERTDARGRIRTPARVRWEFGEWVLYLGLPVPTVEGRFKDLETAKAVAIVRVRMDP